MTSILRHAGLLLAIVVGARSTSAQNRLSPRQQAIVRAILFVRDNASEELRGVPPADITIDGTRLTDQSVRLSDLDAAALGKELRAHLVRGLASQCVGAGSGLSTTKALFARAECVTETSRYYVEPGDLEVNADTATITVHVFRRPVRSGVPLASRVDYAGYKIALSRSSNGWGSPRLVSITET